MQRKGNKKWGTLDEETKQFSTRKLRKVRKIDEALTNRYDDYGDENDTGTFTLEEYQTFLASRKPVTNGNNKNNKNNNNNNNKNNNNTAVPGLSKVQVAQLGAAHKLMHGRHDSTSAPLSGAEQISFLQRDIQNKDLESLKMHALMYLSKGHNHWEAHEITNFVTFVLDTTEDEKIFDIVFLTPLLYWDTFYTSHYLLSLYDRTPATTEKFHKLITYFLDIGGVVVKNSMYEFGQKLVAKCDIDFLELLLNHEALHSYLRWSSSALMQYILPAGDYTQPLLERLLTEFPKLANEERYVFHHEGQRCSPLFSAAELGHVKLVETLLAHKADPNYSQSGRHGKRVLDVATKPEIQELLQKYGSVKPKREIGAVGGKALKRIMHDWLEITRDPPSASVRAIPDEKNMFEWHVIITPPDYDHPLSGCNFHFIMQFPLDYPDSPPHIKGSQVLPHPNYFGGYICLNMLRPAESGKYSGWSSGYSALSILMQLQSFLFDEEVDQDYGGTRINTISQASIDAARLSCAQFRCKICGFNHKWRGLEGDLDTRSMKITPAVFDKIKRQEGLPFMSAPDYGHVEDPSKWIKRKEKEEFTSSLSLTTIPDDGLVNILDYLVRIEDLAPALRVCKHIQRVGEKYSIWIRRELICYYSKASFTDDILGVGVTVERGGGGKIKSISSPLDLISKTAFFHDYIRRSSWQEKFDYWLPLIINQRHAQRSLTYLQATIAAIIYDVSFEIDEHVRDLRREGVDPGDSDLAEQKLISLASKFKPLMVLDVIPKLMNQTIVAIMRDTADDQIFLHHSEKALLGYCSYHHILLTMCQRYPEIQAHIDRVLEQFCRHESARVKLAQPDLGELLVYLSVASRVTWRHIGQVFVQELFDRNVVWIFDNETGKGHGELAYLENSPVSDYRLKTTLNSSITGLRLLMFQVFFLEKVGRPTGLTPKDVLARLNDSYGHPRAGIPTLLQKECGKLYKVDAWPQFFERIGLACPSKEQMTTILRQAVLNSERKGYHVNRMEPKKLFEWRVKVDKEFAATKPTAPQDAQDASASAAHADASKKQDASAKPQAPAQAKAQTPASGAKAAQPAQGAKDATKPATKPVKIYVGNLSYRVTALDLEFVFQQFGKLVSSQVMYDENDKPRGFGFIEVENEDVATTLLEFMQGADVDNRPVKLERVDRNRPFKPRPTNNTPQDKKPSQNNNTNNNNNIIKNDNNTKNNNTKNNVVPKPVQKTKPQKVANKKNEQNPFAGLGDE